MKFIIKHIISAALSAALLAPCAALAQESENAPRASYLFSDGIVAPASPEAAAVARYGDVADCNLNTGAVGLSIPVYTYSDNDFTIPVALSYSSNGYRPNVQSGVMGLGWYPSTGWSVTREVRGIMDDAWPDLELYHFENKFAHTGEDSEPEVSVYGYGFMHDPGAVTTQSITSISGSLMSEDLVLQSKAGAEYMPVLWYNDGHVNRQTCFETEPDVFSFSAPGGVSGKFILRPDGGASFFDTGGAESEYRVSVTLERSGFTSFVITDAGGYRYTYSEADSNESWSLRGDSDNVSSYGSWRLSSVEAPSGRKILLSYGVESSSLSVMPSKTIESNYRVSHDEAHPLHPDDGDSSEHEYGGTWEDMNYSRTFSPCITGISVRNSDGTRVCSMAFSYTPKARERGADSYACYKLSGITVTNSLGRTVKSCTLDYVMDYEAGRASGTYDPDGRGVTFLKSVRISGEGLYSFEYRDRTSTTFPALGTWGTDWYGYWAPSVTSPNYFAPQSLAYCRQNLSTSPWLTSLRQPDGTSAQKGMLERVTWPTGGWSTFAYEANSYSRDKSCMCSQTPLRSGTASGVRVARISAFDSDGTEVQRRDFSYVGADGVSSSGELIWRPSIYTKYHMSGTQYHTIDREVMSTANDYPYSGGDFLGYLRVLESVYAPRTPSDRAIIEHVFSPAETGSCTTFSGPLWTINADTFSVYGLIWNCSVSTTLPTASLYAGLTNCQQGTMKGRPVSRTEYAGSLSAPVTKTTFLYDEYGDVGGTDFMTMRMGFGTTERRFHPGVHPVGQTVESYGTQDRTEVIPVLREAVLYDGMNRVARIRRTSGTGGTLETLFEFDDRVPTLLKEKTLLRDGCIAASTGYSYLRPDASAHPSWYVPWKVLETKVDYPYEMEEDVLLAMGRVPVATFGDYDAAGNPHSVTDAEGNVTLWEWGAQYAMMHPTRRTFHPAGQSGPGLVTQWEWIPLVGPVSETAPSGKVSAYTYDSEGRLRSVLENGGCVKSLDYNIVTGASAGSVSGLTLPQGRNWTCITTPGGSSGAGDAHDIAYYDGLGSETQVHLHTPSFTGTASATSYDALRRPFRKWLPYPDGAPSYDPWFFQSQYEWYYDNYDIIEDADYTFSETRMETAPSGRVLSETIPGMEMADHPSECAYMTNTAQDAVRMLSSDPDTGALVDMGFHPAGSLSGVRTVDGDGRTATVWTDAEGRTVREDRVLSGTATASTLYAYDWRGNLTWVIQPEGVAQLNGITSVDCEAASKWCFVYVYDERNRVVEKRVPGKGAERYTYDDLDRVVTSRDALQASRGEHVAYAYDALGREISRTLVRGSGASAVSVPLSTARYDSYSQDAASPVADGVYVSGTALSSPAGLLAGETLALLDGESPADAPDSVQYATRTYWYDSRERLVQSLESRPDGSTIRTSFQYDLQGNVLKRKETVTGPGNAGTTAMLSEYTYDARGRVLNLGRTLDGETLDTVEYGYDNLGHLASKTVGGKLTEAYTYDLRGWMKDLEASRGTDVLFSEGLMYDLHRMPGSVSQYSGNISEIETIQYGKATDIYAYSYDGFSRLSDARHFIGGSTTASDTDTERSISYDLNGNILGMTRYGAESSGASVLGFSYTGNRLTGAAESSAAGSPNYMYAYDSNGNRTLDSRTGLEFTHNLLNLPCEVRDSQDNMRLRYTYLSDGTKVSALDAAGDGLLYCGNFVYDRNGSNVNLESVAWDEGRIRNKLYQGLLHGDDPIDVTDTLAVTDTLPEFPRHPWHPFNRVLPAEEENADPVEIEDLTDVQAVVFSPFQDQWFVKDHLGNVRSVINLTAPASASPDSVILEQNDYLPYGTKVSDASTPALSGNRYRYAGKEEQRFGTFDSQLLDFGARHYDPWSCQWTATDPMGEKYYSMTPYGYCGASPVMFMDPKGMDIYTMDSKGNIKLYQNTDDEYDEAYAEWGDGPLDQNAAHVIIHDKFILPSMAQGNDPSGDCSRLDMKSLFKFAADTFDSQEWGLYYNKDAYELTTEADGARVSTSLNGVTWKVHSHPNEPANDKAEIESMGYWTYDDSAYDSKGNLLNNNASWYESAFAGNDASNHINSHGVVSYVYFPVSGNSYRLTKNQLPYKTIIK